MTSPLTIAVCFPRPLFTACDEHEDAITLLHHARAAGHDAEALTLPTLNAGREFSHDDALTWALIDLAAGGQRAIDAVVCLHPTTMVLRHPVKIAWMRSPWDVSMSTVLGMVNRVVVTDARQSDGTDAPGPPNGSEVVRADSVADVLDVVCACSRSGVGG